MNKNVKIILIIAVGYAVIYFILRKIKQKTYLDYLHQLGFNIADKMTFDEQKTAYTYLHDYARKFGSNAGNLLRATNPTLYSKAIALSKKYKIFNVGSLSSDTNIPNIEIPIGAAPIVPDVPLPTSGKPSTGTNIIPPTLNIV